MITYLSGYSVWMKNKYIFNSQNDMTYNTELMSYAVDDKGNIDFPLSGTLMLRFYNQ